MTYIFSLTVHNGMPVGLQIVAPPRGEERALALASVMQRLRPVPLPVAVV